MFRGITTPQATEELKSIQKYTLKHFTFCYNNACLIYEEAKYGVSYWLQEPHPSQFKGTNKEKDDLYDDNSKGDTFSDIKSIKVRFFTVQAGINADLA